MGTKSKKASVIPTATVQMDMTLRREDLVSAIVANAQADLQEKIQAKDKELKAHYKQREDLKKAVGKKLKSIMTEKMKPVTDAFAQVLGTTVTCDVQVTGTIEEIDDEEEYEILTVYLTTSGSKGRNEDLTEIVFTNKQVEKFPELTTLLEHVAKSSKIQEEIDELHNEVSRIDVLEKRAHAQIVKAMVGNSPEGKMFLQAIKAGKSVPLLNIGEDK